MRKQDPNTIWTLIDGEDGDLYVVSGYHLVNRIGYRTGGQTFVAYLPHLLSK